MDSLEYWSAGVLEILFPNTPLLQYSITPINSHWMRRSLNRNQIILDTIDGLL
jgi:hypothetical protein